MSVTLGSFTYPNANGYSGVVTLRLWYTGCTGQQFIDVDEVAVPCGSNASFYMDIPCTLVDDVITVPDSDIFTTDDSQSASVLASAQFFVDGAPRDFLFTDWIITATLGASITFPQLWIFNLLVTPAYTLSASYLTAPQVAALIAAATSGSIHGTLTPGAVPRALLPNTVIDSQITDDGTDISARTLNYFQAGDYTAQQNASYIDVNDTLGVANLFAGADAQAEYAGIAAVCGPGSAEVFVQGTDYTYLYGAFGVAKLGDGEDQNNGTKVTIDDVAETISLDAANGVLINGEAPVFNSASEGSVPRVGVDGNLEAGGIADAPTTGNPDGQVTITEPIGTDQMEAGTTLGNVIGFIPVFDSDGVSLGKLPIYDDIT